MVTVSCVLKSGGVYDWRYVLRLRRAVEKNTTAPYQFICFTDDDAVVCCDIVRLKHNWPGWWSKIELFRSDLDLRCFVYFDLDTMIIGNIDELIRCAQETPFGMLRGFNKHNSQNNVPASGVMVGDFSMHSEVYHAFVQYPGNWMGAYGGDQGFISDKILGIVPRLQNLLPKDYIVGKRIAFRENFVLPSTSVIAWSGRPRLHEAKEKFIVDYWNAN